MRRRYSSQETTPFAPGLGNNDNFEKKCLRKNQQNHETKMCKVSGFQILNFDITVVGERDGSAKMCSCQMGIVTKNKNVILGVQFQSGNIWHLIMKAN